MLATLWFLTGRFDGLNNLNIARAATQVSSNAVPDFFLSGAGIFIEQCLRREDHSGRTEAALDRTMFNESVLDGMKVAPRIAETFDRGDVLSCHLHGRVDAGIDRFPVQQHGAGTTFAHPTTFLRSEEFELIPEQL